MNDIIKKKIEEREMKKNICFNNKLNSEALLSYNEAKREVSRKIETPEQGTTTMNLILINIIVATPAIL